ncbi:MAG TPA: tetratricopeptide repeat protein [Rhodocyclaceae bacterium]|nr:tetratricopeptide repeat protein [Rhodocyclaceae bacterium]
MLKGSRFWAAACLAGLLSFSVPVLADADADYDQGYRQFYDGDMTSAMISLRKAANAGHIKAMVLLAEVLDASEFDEEAVGLYRKAAEAGDADGMFGLGAMTVSGEGLKAKDTAEGMRWIRKAAELGQNQAVIYMAQAYLKAEQGLTEADRDTPEALRWVKQAAAKDYLPAVDALAQAYSTGGKLSVSADPVLAGEYQAQANKIRNIEPTKGKKKKKATAS